MQCGVMLFALGLLVNGFPTFHVAHLRIPGILQRIGVCYVLAAALYLWLKRPGVTRVRRVEVIGGVCFALLAGYWTLLMLYPTPGFGPGRLDSLGCLPAVVTERFLDFRTCGCGD